MYEEAFPRGRIVLQQFDETDWEVHEIFSFFWKEQGITITAWKHFLTDQASVFSIVPDAILNNTGPITNGAVPHDMYYKLLAHSVGIPFRCIYDMLQGQYLSKNETDRMFWAANRATNEMSWRELLLTKLVILNLPARWKWMPRRKWDKQVLLMNLGKLKGAKI